MAFNIKYVYDLVDDISPKLKKIESSMKQAQMSIKNSASKISSSLKEVSSKAKDLGKSLFLKLTVPIAGLGAAILKSSSQMETLRTSFVGILGDADKAKQIVSDLSEFTARTPFQLEAVAASARQLLAAGVQVSEIPGRLQLLGDISAAANVPLNDMSAIFAKIKNKGKAMTEEILQMSDRGIPIIAKLSKQFGVNKEAIFEMASQGKISFDLITKAMMDMTREGGFANKAMILQSKTLTGLLSTTRDNVSLLFAQIGEVFLDDIKTAIVSFIELLQKFKKFAQENQKLVKTLAIIGGMAALLSPILIAIGLMVPAITGLITVVGALGTALLFLAANPIGLVIAALAGFIIFSKNFRNDFMVVFGFISDAFISFWASLKDPIVSFVTFFTDKIGFIIDGFRSLGKIGAKIFGADMDISQQLQGGLEQTTNINQNQNSNLQGRLDVNFNNIPKGSSVNTNIGGNTDVNLGTNLVFAGG